MSETLVDRLRGLYSVGPKGEYGKRDFSEFIPAISLEAANRIEELENELLLIIDNSVFIDHIKSHLDSGVPVVCKICGKTVDQIVAEAGR